MTPQTQNLGAFARVESKVRSYIHAFPTCFTKARGSRLWDEAGNEYVDFFSGAGVLNYGHSHPVLKQALLDYIQKDGIAHSLDMATAAKRTFLERFEALILKPRGLDYVVQFPGPTGTNAVEAALKLARKFTGRESIISFTNAFHGMTLGALSVTGNAFKRAGAGVPLSHANVMPYCSYIPNDLDSLEFMRQMLSDTSSGVDLPAAIIVETVQAEGGINVASYPWLKRLAAVAKEFRVLLIVDDIQVGNGRTGPFFSFEPAGIEPDIVCLSKSLSGSGQPFAVTLLRRELDIWAPGEHNGTFRGNNYAFVTAAAALETYWQDDGLSRKVEADGDVVRKELAAMATRHADLAPYVVGRGMINGIAFEQMALTKSICRAAFERGLVLETSGPKGTVAKVMPPLTVDTIDLNRGLDILHEAVDEAVAAWRKNQLKTVLA